MNDDGTRFQSLNYASPPPQDPYGETPTFTGAKKALIIAFLILAGSGVVATCSICIASWIL